jgi:hypothetical protein
MAPEAVAAEPLSVIPTGAAFIGPALAGALPDHCRLGKS